MNATLREMRRDYICEFNTLMEDYKDMINDKTPYSVLEQTETRIDSLLTLINCVEDVIIKQTIEG